MKLPRVIHLEKGNVIVWPDGLRTLCVRDTEGNTWFATQQGPNADDHQATSTVLAMRHRAKAAGRSRKGGAQ